MSAESLHILRDAGVEMIIAIDSTRRGPALGGCRWRPYPDSETARREALSLAAAMTRKAAMARVSLGGGKAVVIGDPRERKPEQLHAFGRFVDSLGGRYITAADMGTGAEEMAQISEATAHVVGLPGRLGGCGEPAPFTALGTFLAIEKALAYCGRSVAGSRVAVQGVGQVGTRLVELLCEADARVIAADPDPERLRGLPQGVEIADCARIATTDCDVFAPCGPPGVITPDLVTQLRCRVVCGAANRPLGGAGVGRALHDAGILYVPDFIANAGGLVRLAVVLDGGDDAAAEDRLRVIPENLEQVLAQAKADRADPDSVAERLALAAVES